MKLLFENWRQYITEADTDNDGIDDERELAVIDAGELGPEVNRSTIEELIGDFSFNSAQSSQHRWSPRQPVIDYRFNERIGNWIYMAWIPDGTNDADNWPRINSKKGEDLKNFLTRVEENPHQLNLGLQ